jgi:hypothetical protein
MTRPLEPRDLSALIGILAVCEGTLMLKEPGIEGMAKHLTQRLQSGGLLDQEATERDLRQALNDLGYRIRYAKGEYAEPPQPSPVE